MAASFLKYNCTVEEGELTSTQRQLKFMEAVQLEQMFPGTIPKNYFIDQSTIQGKKEIKEYIDQQEKQQQQMQQQQFQAEMQKEQVLARSLEAKAQLDFSSAEEKKAQGVQKIALAKQEASQAVHQRAAAALDNARALKELDEMDENRLMKLADFIVELQLKQKQIQGGEEGDSEAKAKEAGASVEAKEQKTGAA
jgi:hypothetical protein